MTDILYTLTAIQIALTLTGLCWVAVRLLRR